MDTLIESLINIVTAVDRHNLYLPPQVAALLRNHGFIPHRTYTRPRRPPPPVQIPCPAMTRAGTPCKNKCAIGCTTCGIHVSNPTPRAPRELPAVHRRCPETVKGGTQCKCPKYNNYSMCWRHAKKANLLPPAPEVPNDCAICYVDLTLETTTKTACGHYFHIECFEAWRQLRRTAAGGVTCPMCRCANTRPKPLVRPV